MITKKMVQLYTYQAKQTLRQKGLLLEKNIVFHNGKGINRIINLNLNVLTNIILKYVKKEIT